MAGIFFGLFCEGNVSTNPCHNYSITGKALGMCSGRGETVFRCKASCLGTEVWNLHPIVNCGHLDQHQSFTPWETSAKPYLWVYWVTMPMHRYAPNISEVENCPAWKWQKPIQQVLGKTKSRLHEMIGRQTFTLICFLTHAHTYACKKAKV